MNDLSPPVDPTDTLADQRVGSGIIVLSASMQLLHMNRQASELAKLINATENGGVSLRSAHGVLPTALTELCGEIIKALHVRTEAKDWELNVAMARVRWSSGTHEGRRLVRSSVNA